MIVLALKPIFPENFIFLSPTKGMIKKKQHTLKKFFFLANWSNFLSQMPIHSCMLLFPEVAIEAYSGK